MIQRDFHRFVGPKSVGLSEGQLRFVVEPLDGACGNLAVGPEPVELQLAMSP